MKKVRRAICLFLASCMIMSVLCFTASAESGTYNNRTYTISLSLGRRAMTSQLPIPLPSSLDFWAMGESSLGDGYAKVSCAKKMVRGQKVVKTINPPDDALQFYHAYQNTIASRIICRPLSAGFLNFK